MIYSRYNIFQIRSLIIIYNDLLSGSVDILSAEDAERIKSNSDEIIFLKMICTRIAAKDTDGFR